MSLVNDNLFRSKIMDIEALITIKIRDLAIKVAEDILTVPEAEQMIVDYRAQLEQ